MKKLDSRSSPLPRTPTEPRTDVQKNSRTKAGRVDSADLRNPTTLYTEAAQEMQRAIKDTQDGTSKGGYKYNRETGRSKSASHKGSSARKTTIERRDMRRP